MADAARWNREEGAGKPRYIPVIADAGPKAWVVLVPFRSAPRLGDTFRFRGLEWVIVRRADATRGFVAHPRRRHPHTRRTHPSGGRRAAAGRSPSDGSANCPASRRRAGQRRGNLPSPGPR